MHQLTLIVAAITATILASPQRRSDLWSDGGNHIQTLGDAAAAQCGNHQQISCCSKGNLAGTLLDGLLGGNCSPIDLSVIGKQVGDKSTWAVGLTQAQLSMCQLLRPAAIRSPAAPETKM
ncbi:hydrophobin [Cordyceps fumosorosea ARSEF 2679]|uniref:Hydrophobin n=1 Tax=Cordyceps fumosorosea (strain ARSEF 2679) TaxID=1081104 RepID=A0A162LQV6_CORFA|nr:hydrophobin [Cordyceps fumosorosea ARSEF 2679]OAA74254.1 hydrophobin [Cordyceps fumosorosea ARSEF 2679]